MKKLFFVLVMALILLGCQGGEENDLSESPFVGGTTGLLLSFTEDAPPQDVYDGGDFPFDVEVKIVNDGETQISKDDVIVELLGIDPVEFGKTSAGFKLSPEEDLIAKKKDSQGNVLESNPVYVTFDELNHESAVAGTLQYPILARVCYKYGTEALSLLCITGDLYSDMGVCAVTEEKKVLNSGAPLQVTTLSESVAGSDKIAFIFKVEQKGNGNVYKYNTDCNDADVRTDVNKVFVTVSTGLPGLQCTGLSDGTASSGYVTLRSGSATVRCIQPVSTETTFQKIVNIKLDYDYEEDIGTTITLKHAD
ncbi:hypothetical protein KY311_02310 [Candidatus Woesearchaeota archaeon]|nr:hypothetical protein [Candidatus Woesearchaeota archaeon]